MRPIVLSAALALLTRPCLGGLDALSIKGINASKVTVVNLTSSSCDAADVRNAFLPLPHSCEATMSALQEAVSRQEIPESLRITEKDTKGAAKLAGALFRVKAHSEEVLATEAKKLKWKAEKYEAPTRDEAKTMQACSVTYKGDEGSIVRCLVEKGQIYRALVEAKKWVQKHKNSSLEFAEGKVKQTMMLLQFGSAFLTDELSPQAKNDHGRTELVQLWREFSTTASRMHIYSPQLGELLLYAFVRLSDLDPEHANHYIVMIDASPPFGIATLDPKSDAQFSHDMHTKGTWEYGTTDILARIFRRLDWRRRLLVDVGANLGWFTNLAASRDVHVIAFEPLPAHCWRLRQSLSLNSFSEQVRLFEVAVSSQKGPLNLAPQHFGSAATSYVNLKPDDKQGGIDALIPVDTMGVDEGVAEANSNGFGREVGVIKIDAEGCEFEALLTARKTIEQFKPELLVETCPSHFHRCATTKEDEAAVWKLLSSSGYHMNVYQHDGGRPAVNLPSKKMRIPGGLRKNHRDVLVRLWEVPRDMDSLEAWILEEKKASMCFQFWASQEDIWQQGSKEEL